jgi:hypothetical protein
MKTQNFFLIVVLTKILLSVNRIKCDDRPFCDGFVPDSNHTTMYPMPQLPDSFQTRVEAYFDDRTINLQRFLDYENRRAAVITKKDNIQTRLIFDYDTNEIHQILSE